MRWKTLNKVDTSDGAKHSIEAHYGGYTMRSLLEKRVAMLLDGLKVEWEYEPRHFKLRDGEVNYLPDFYLPNHDQYIEAKGVFSEQDKRKVTAFAQEVEDELVMLRSQTAHFVLNHPKSERPSFGQCHLVECSECSSFSIVPDYGAWGCRVCGHHPGDQDIKKYNLMGTSDNTYTSSQDLYLKNRDRIQLWVEEVAGQ